MDQPGEPVGIRNAQSILRKATQNSLSHFHVAGMEKGNYQQNSPTIADAMDSKYSSKNTSATFSVSVGPLGRINKHLVGKKLSWFVTMIRSSITELPEHENIWYESSNQKMFSETILRLYIDYKKLLQFNLTLEDIAQTCFSDIPFHTSPDWMGMIDLDILGNYVSLVLSKIDTVFCGSPLIFAVHANVNIDTTVNAVTSGSDIVSISQLPHVIKNTIRSNHVLDVQKNLGIEAAAYILREIIGSDVISDFMTRTGIVLPFYNSSLEVFNKGVLTAMAFERPRTHIQKFLKYSSWDKHPSVYADIMVGNNPEKDFSIKHAHN